MTDQADNAPEKRRYLRPVGKTVDQRVDRLQAAYLAGKPSAKRDLAELREAIDEEPGSEPRIWRLTEYPPSEWAGDLPTPEENAVHIALCLYGQHQQGRSAPAYQPGRSFAQAVRSLAGEEAEKSPVWKRFAAAMLANDIRGTREHLQALVGLMHSNKAFTAFDYGRLADDLVELQSPEGQPAVRLRWQRDFYSITPDKDTDSAGKEAGLDTEG